MALTTPGPSPETAPDGPPPADRLRPALPAALARATELGFRTLAALRRARALHPVGATFVGTAAVDPASGLTTTEVVAVVVRLSRGGGLPDGLPDVHGVAIRFVDAHGPGTHQDLLLSSALTAPGLRWVLRPTRRLGGAASTSVLPFRRPGGGRTMFRCDRIPLDRLDDVPAALPLDLVLRQATPFGRWRAVAAVRLLEPAPESAAIGFDPWTTTEELVPSGLLNRLRSPAYTGSRAGSGR